MQRSKAFSLAVSWGWVWLIAWALLLLGACGCGGVLAGAPMTAPTWERVALGVSGGASRAGSVADSVRDLDGAADFVGAIDLEAIRADPLFGPVLEHLARKAEMGVLVRAKQIDLVATVDRGRPTTWLAVVHGVDGPPGKGDLGGNLGPPQPLGSGVTEYRGSENVLAVPGAWIVGAGEAYQRARSNPTPATERIAMPPRALVASTIQGRALTADREEVPIDMTQGLRDATAAMLGGAHLELVLRCEYVDGASARHAAAAARLLLLAAASRSDLAATLSRALMKVDFDVSGAVVSLRVTISDDLREVLQTYVERAAQ